MSAVQVNDQKGNYLGKVKVGDTKQQALERLSLAGGLFDKDDIGLLDDDCITTEGEPYVFKRLQPQQEQILEYKWETIFANQTSIDMSEEGAVVSGWRRENGITTRAPVFLRPHLIEKKEEVDKFFCSTEKKRLYVSGPPGSGKTSFFLLYCAQRAFEKRQRALVVQYRDSGACDIMIVDQSNIRRVSLEYDLSREILSAVLREVVRREQPFNFFVFDGVRQKVKDCGDVLGYLNAQIGRFYQKGIHITSLQFSIKAGDGTFPGDQYMSILSWELPDYMAAYHSKLLSKDAWRDVLVDDEEMKDGENDDDQMTEPDDEDEAVYLSLLERKFYYAGGSVRFMLDYTLPQLVSDIFPVLLGRMTASLWEEFSELKIRGGTESTVNSLMQLLPDWATGDVAFPVSKYILHKAYENCRAKLVRAVKAAAESTGNPALQGWAFELAQIEWINVAIENEKLGVKNGSGDLVLPISMVNVTYDGRSLSGDASVDSFVIKCVKWNQGCFDMAFFHHGKLITIQFTVSTKHTLKLPFIRHLKENLEVLGKTVDDTVNHIAIVEDDNIAAMFNFETPESGSGSKEFKVALAKSTKLSASIEATQSGSLELKMGIPIDEVIICPKQRSSKRPRKEVSCFTYL